MKIKNKAKHILSAALSAVMLLGSLPTLTYAAQVNEYVDPADIWVSANGRTNELDFNATITQETGWCPVCNKDTIMLTYRTPEYTKSGSTALNRGVKYSDGTMVDGKTTGNLDNGRPNQDAAYTTYHWTKSVCQTCGTINSIDGEGDYAFSRNVYGLNSCDHNFFLDFDNTTYEPYSSTKHTTILKRGKYCQFCKGTQARATESLENHHFTETIDGQLGNNRFYVSEHCDDCGYETSEYITAKSVVSSYYGTADENAHTVTISDLSDSGVHTSIRYGTSAGKCNLTSAPNYTEAGYYPVYYEIDYKYDGKNMTENGVSYVWLLEKEGDTIIVIPPVNNEEKHTHDFRYLETVAPSCDNLGYERWQCDGCGALEKRNYTPAVGHDYENITIREATCKQGGLSLSLCKNCGDFHQTTTPTGEHKYRAEKHNPTCRVTGYTEYICEVCGDSYMNNITPIISHAFERITKKPTCTDKGYTTSTCTMCGLNYVSDYTEPTGHNWDEGHTVTSSTCESEGITEFHCLNCDEKMIKSESATGHTPGKAATCTEPQTCEKCGTVLELPKGHNYSETVIAPTCEAMGYSVFECTECGDSYTGNFTDKAEHDYKPSVTAPTCTQHGFTTYTCKNCNDEYISDYTEKIPHDYKAEITNPTCTEFGHTTYTCSVCGESYTADYTDKLPHNYNKQVIPPTCTEHGYTIYKCPDCGNEYIKDNKIYVELPEGTAFDYNNRITATVTDKDNNPVKDMSVTFTDSTEKTETNLTDENGRATVPPVNIDYTDVNGYSEVDGYIVTVVNEAGAIEKSFVTHTEDNRIIVELPENVKFDYANRITVTVLNKPDKTAVKDMNVTVSEKAVVTEEAADVKSLSGVTNNDGKAVFPPLSEDITDDNGSSDITEEKPGKGEDTDGDGVEDKPGEIETVTYKVSVNDTKGIINNAFVEIKDGKVYVTLPDTHTLTTSNQTTVTVLDKDENAVKGVSVTIKDKTTEKTESTDATGKVTLPVKTSSGGSSSGGSSGGGGGSYSSYSTVNVKVIDKDGKTVSVTKSVDSKGNVTVTLPTGKVIDSENYYTVTVTDSKGSAKADTTVTLKDRKNGTATGATDKNGMLTLPATEHKAYIVGYDDGTFKPDSNMSRAEAAAIFARLIAEAKGETVSGKSSFADVSSKEWYSSYIGYLEKYDVINGYTDGTFKPDASVTRAEFVAMTVRYYDLFNDVNKTGNTVKYTDVSNSYWAYSDIAFAKNIGWLNGYSDGSFRGDNDITRAEVVTVVNRATGRVADTRQQKSVLSVSTSAHRR